jgi:hypothetical protein
MPIDEEQPSIALEIIDASKRMLQEKILSSAFAGVFSLIPGVGGAVIEILTELAIQRVDNRVNGMFEHFTNRILEVGEDKVDREWFRSEEFQTLLFEAFRQLNVTHDREKIEMLGVALANSGTSGFKDDDRKDLFVQFVRDLTRQHLKVLLELAPPPLQFYDFPTITPDTDDIKARDLQPRAASPDEKTGTWLRWNRRRRVSPHGDDLLAVQMLHAYGLVEEEIKSSIKEPHLSVISSASQAREAVRQFIRNVENAKIERSFRLSPLGDEFLKFMGLPKNVTQ